MRYRCCVWLSLFVLSVVCSAAQRGAEGAVPGEQFLGAWAGTWDGAGTGGFELTLEKDKDGALGGKVSVTGEPTYKAILKTVSIDGNKMSAKYDFTPDERAEVIVAAELDGNTLKGTWTLRDKASATDLATGGLSVNRK